MENDNQRHLVNAYEILREYDTNCKYEENKYNLDELITQGLKQRGVGYLIVYHFNESFLSEKMNLTSILQGHYDEGISIVLLMDYIDSDLGPYSELMFLGGKYKFENKRYLTVMKAYTTLQEDLDFSYNGLGIKKKLASFKKERIDDLRERIYVKGEDGEIIDIVFNAKGKIMPLSHFVLPIHLLQYTLGYKYYSKFTWYGNFRPSTIESCKVNANNFPDIESAKPLFIFKMLPMDIKKMNKKIVLHLK